MSHAESSILVKPLIHSIAHKAINLNITTKDNVRLGAWLVLSDSFYQASYQAASRPTAPFSESDISLSLASHPTVIYFHGNAANRAASSRVALYMSVTSKLGANVLAVDYRGFGNSEGTPNEVGLGYDGRATWDWLVQRGVKPSEILIMGQSLGTGVATTLAAGLAEEGDPFFFFAVFIKQFLTRVYF